MTLPPPITLEQLRKRAGLPDGDTSKDVELDAAFGIGLAMVERYLDRGLIVATETELFTTPTKVMTLHRWPIIAVASITWDGGLLGPLAADLYWIDADKGEIHVRWPLWWRAPLIVEYEGGFAELPPELAWALLQVFDAVWMNDPAFGGTQGGLTLVSGQKFSVTGVGSIDYGSASGGVMGSASDPWGMIPASAGEVLGRYANHPIYGGA